MLYVNPILERHIADGAVSQGAGKGREDLALQELEHHFLFMLMREMRSTAPTDPLLGGQRERAMFEEMLDDALSGEMAKSGQLGLAAQIRSQLHIADAQRDAGALDSGATSSESPLAPVKTSR